MSTEIKSTEAFTTPDGKTAIKYDVVNESLLNNKPLEDVFEEMRYNDEAVINTPEYYKSQYGVKANPSNPNALEDKQIDMFVSKAKILKEQFGKMKEYGTTPGEVSVQRDFLKRKAKYKSIVLNPYMGEIGSDKAYKGFLNPETGTYATIGTEEEIAEANRKPKAFTLKCDSGTFELEVSKEGIYYRPENVFLNTDSLEWVTLDRTIKSSTSKEYKFTGYITKVDLGCKKNIPIEDVRAVINYYNSIK